MLTLSFTTQLFLIYCLYWFVKQEEGGVTELIALYNAVSKFLFAFATGCIVYSLILGYAGNYIKYINQIL